MLKNYKLLALLIMVTVLMIGCTSDKEGVTLNTEEYESLLEKATEYEALKEQLKIEEELNGVELIDSVESKEVGDTEKEADEVETEKALIIFRDASGEYGFKDHEGNIVLYPSFDSVTDFWNGVAVASDGFETSLVSETGEMKLISYKEASLNPFNNHNSNSDIEAFHEAFIQALNDKNLAFIMEHLDENIKLSFGGDGGKASFKTFWNLEQDPENSDFWDIMLKTIQFGFVSVEYGGFTAPYVFTDFPYEFDSFSYMACTGENVNVRMEPDENSVVIRQLSYTIVKVTQDNFMSKNGDWQEITLPDGKIGYVHKDLIRSPIDYRVHVNNDEGEWLIDFFVAGD